VWQKCDNGTLNYVQNETILDNPSSPRYTNPTADSARRGAHLPALVPQLSAAALETRGLSFNEPYRPNCATR